MVKFLIDESVNYKLVKILRQKSIDVISVMENYPGITDQKVIELAINKRAIIITEDSDFGEWVFAHKIETIGVIYLRYRYDELINITNTLLKVISKYNENLYRKFIVIKPNKIRVINLL
ncbi:toxin-antitoxin system, toxin component [Deferribacter autotrophicus]|uniref:Toxin-antitoxin system, toxin component n=1 Tax=Deferribacter autotrophicus TaxID=500465 RepID=A0A5A8F4Y8_9BACT|nr:DUF5615 family PIN-like protein [Deferribacter autotrophicus]KAA0257722.1 toxin-antitoxin system, toxin component [Deferribacter autotrophicus]